MVGWIILAVVLLLAAPVMAIIALVVAIGDSTLLRQLNERLKFLERVQAAQAARRTPPPEPTPQPAPAPIVAAPAEPPPPLPPPPPPQQLSPPPASVPVSSSPPAPPSPPKIGFEEKFGTRWVVWVGGVALALGGI